MLETLRRLGALQEAARAMNSIQDPDQLLSKILSLIEDVFRLDTCAVLLHEPSDGSLRIRASRGYRADVVEGFRGQKGLGVTGKVFESGRPMLVNDVAGCNGYVEGVEGACSEMAAPLCIGDEIIGVLDAESRSINAFVEADLELFDVFASQAATALRNARLIRQLEHRSQQLEKNVNELALLNLLGRQLNANLSLDSLLAEVLRLAREAFRFDHCAVLLKESLDGEEYLVIRAALGYRDEVVGLRIRPGEGVTGRTLKSGQPVLVEDVEHAEGYIPGVAGGRCEMATPLWVRDEVIGVLDAESTVPGAFSPEDLRLFSTFGSMAGIALHNAEIVAQLERKKAQLDRNMDEMNRMNRELKEYAARIEQANRDLEKRVRELTTLQEASHTITSSLNLSDTLEAIVRMTREIVSSSSCAIRLLDEESEEMKAFGQVGNSVLSGEDAASTNGRSELRSFLGVPLKIGNRVIGYFELGSLNEGAFGDDDRRILQVLASQAAIAIENARLFESTQRTYYETIRSLAHALEARDTYTKGHSERVTRFATETARLMGLSELSLRVIQYAGMLHDIGKIGISDSILHKQLALSEDEWTEIRNHPLFGDTILGPLKFLTDAQRIVLRHHERFDGTGYPGHLRGEDIPLEARIIAVADAYDAMTSDRPYRKALRHEDAIGELQKESGKSFDPNVVQAFLSVLDEIRRGFESA